MAFMSDDGEFYVYTVVEVKTGEIVEGDILLDSLENPDDMHDLIDGYEWRKFKLVAADT